MHLQLIGPAPPTGCSSIYLSQKLHTCPHSWWRPLSWGSSLLPMVGKMKLTGSLGHHPNNQIMWTVHGNCRSGSIVGMCFFSQMRWQVSFLVFSQLPNHVHNHLVQSFYQPFCLGVVGHSLQSLDAEDLAQFFNNATGKASTSVPSEPGWGPKDRDVASI